MAKICFISFIFIFLFLTTISNSIPKTHSFVQPISPTTLGLHKPQKLSHLRFYFHDIISGKNQTAFRVASSPSTNNSPTGFGSVIIMDDPLTVSPESSSEIVGRAQGIYASASRSELGLLMVVNFGFIRGKYNGSSLSVLGRNTVESAVREMPVVGGSGLFRFATGYAQASTHSLTEVYMGTQAGEVVTYMMAANELSSHMFLQRSFFAISAYVINNLTLVLAALYFYRYIDLDTPLLLSDDPVLEGYEGATYTFTNAMVDSFIGSS